MKKGIKDIDIIFLIIIFLTVTISALAYQELTGYAAKTQAATQCSDHIDNNKNGYCDYNYRGAYCSDGSFLGDPGCSSKSDTIESSSGIAIPDFKCAPFFNATWSNSSGVLDGFDWNNYATYLSVVNNAGIYALQTFGDLGIHRFNRVDVKNLNNLQDWGATVYVNLKDAVHYSSPSDLVFLGAYNGSGIAENWMRDLGIAAAATGGKLYIYMKPYYHDVYAGAYSDSQKFAVNDANFILGGNNVTGWPNRYIKIDWYFKNYQLYGRVDNQPWRLVDGGVKYTNFANIAVGWVSSYSGGNIKFKSLLLYNSTCIPS